MTSAPNFRAVLQHLRRFSSSDKRSPVVIHLETEESASSLSGDAEPLTLPDPNLEFLKDKRLPLPGSIGVGNQISLTEEILLDQPTVINSELFETELAAERYKNVIIQALKVEQEIIMNEKETDSPVEHPVTLEYAIRECSSSFNKAFSDLFVDRDITSHQLTVVTLSQKTVRDMSEWDAEVEEEREELVANFIETAGAICEKLRAVGFWADFIEPCSGRPYFGSFTNATMFETDERYRLFGFTIEDLGCCKVIKHHMWGTHAFIGCIFTNAPADDPFLKMLLNRQLQRKPDTPVKPCN